MDHARAIKALTNCGAITAALEKEHEAIDSALHSLNAALVAGASAETIVQIMDMVVDFCTAHFRNEEEAFIGSSYTDADAHASAHAELLRSFQAVRLGVSNGIFLARLEGTDLLKSFHAHIERFDRAAHADILVAEFVKKWGSGVAEADAELERSVRELRTLQAQGPLQSPAQDPAPERAADAERLIVEFVARSSLQETEADAKMALDLGTLLGLCPLTAAICASRTAWRPVGDTNLRWSEGAVADRSPNVTDLNRQPEPSAEANSPVQS